MKSYLNSDEVKLLESAANNLRDRLLIRILFRLGCRVSEALALSVEDVDFSQGTITIQHLKIRLKLACPRCGTGLGKRHKFCPGCGQRIDQALIQQQECRRVRTLPVNKKSLEMLNQYISRSGPVYKDSKKLIFGINRHRAWQIVRECAEKANLAPLINPETGKMHGISPHRLRDAFAIHAMKLDDSGDGLRLLQEHLGHASFNTTAKYRKVAGEEHREWYQKLWSDGT